MFYFDVAAIMPQKTVSRQRKRTVPRGVVEGSSSKSEDVEFNEFDLDTASSEASVGDAPQSAEFPWAICNISTWNLKQKPNI